MRVLKIRKLHRVNHSSVADFVQRALQEFDRDLSETGCWLTDGDSVNGVRDLQHEYGDNVWALITTEATWCLRFWCGALPPLSLMEDQPAAEDMDMAALQYGEISPENKDLWRHPDLKEWLTEFDCQPSLCSLHTQTT
eukprot:12431447-Karenia_brevis.AAC.1